MDDDLILVLERKIMLGVAGHRLAQIEEKGLVLPFIVRPDDLRPVQIGVAGQSSGDEDHVLDAHIFHKGDVATELGPILDLQQAVGQISLIGADKVRPENTHVFRGDPAEVFDLVMDAPHRCRLIVHIHALEDVLDQDQFRGDISQGATFFHLPFDFQKLVSEIGAAHLDQLGTQIAEIFRRDFQVVGHLALDSPNLLRQVSQSLFLQILFDCLQALGKPVLAVARFFRPALGKQVLTVAGFFRSRSRRRGAAGSRSGIDSHPSPHSTPGLACHRPHSSQGLSCHLTGCFCFLICRAVTPNLPFDPDKGAVLEEALMEDIDAVPGLQLHIRPFILFQQQVLQIQGHQDGFHVRRLQTLDEGVFEVGFTQQVIAVLEQIAHAHPRFHLVFPRTLDVAVEIDDVHVDIHDRKDLHQVGVVESDLRSLGHLLVVDVHNDVALVPDDPFDLDLLGVGGGGDAAGQFQEIFQIVAVLQLVKGGAADVAGDAGYRPGDGDEDHIAGQKGYVMALVAFEEEIVKVEGRHEAAFTFQLDVAHGTYFRGPPRREQGVGDRGEGTDGVGTGTLDVADHEDGDHLGRSHRDVDIGPHNLFRLFDDQFGHLLEGQAGHMERSDLRDGDLAVPVHYEVVLGVDATPEEKLDLIAGADDITHRHGHVLAVNGNAHLRLAEKIGAEALQVRGYILILSDIPSAVEYCFFLVFLNGYLLAFLLFRELPDPCGFIGCRSRYRRPLLDGLKGLRGQPAAAPLDLRLANSPLACRKVLADIGGDCSGHLLSHHPRQGLRGNIRGLGDSGQSADYGCNRQDKNSDAEETSNIQISNLRFQPARRLISGQRPASMCMFCFSRNSRKNAMKIPMKSATTKDNMTIWARFGLNFWSGTLGGSRILKAKFSFTSAIMEVSTCWAMRL